MKVVIFCGGQGMRMREASEVVPKPMIPIGSRPVLWHVMKYYAHFGFTDFVLCLGYKAEVIKQFFLTYNEAMANDFVLSDGGAKVHLLKTDIHDWNITFVDTGLQASIGERLRAVRHLLTDDEIFLANYGDTLTDADLPAMIARARDERHDGELSRGTPELQLPRRLDEIRRARPRDARRDGLRHLDQRRLLRLAPGVPRRAPPRRGPRRGAAAEARARRARFSATGTRDSGRRWTRSRTSSGSRACTRAAGPRGRCGIPTAPPIESLEYAGLRLMLPLTLGRPEAAPARVLAIGAHPDDIEIGCAGTILKLIEQGAVSEVHWVVLSGERRARRGGTRRAPEALLDGVPRSEVVVCDFPDGFFPYEGQRIKDFFERLKVELSPDVVLTHQRADLHQDHRLCCELTWNTFRDHLILEYEVPKYDGDMSAPNAFVPLSEGLSRRKIDHLMSHFGSQVPSAGSGRTCSRACCACAAWSAIRRARTPRRSSAARPCWRDHRAHTQRRRERTSDTTPTS